MADRLVITPKNWGSFQHYKDRSPKWIKLHRALLDDFDFCCLPIASRALAPFLWLLASEYEDGKITASLDELAFRLRMTRGQLAEALSPLLEKGFFDASEPLAERKQVAIQEKERETEGEVEKREIGGGVERARAPSKSMISPEAFEISGRVLTAMGKDMHDPIAVGAPLSIQGWLNAGWNGECILIGVQRGMNSRNGDPPTTLKYFEKAIARAHAELTPSVPKVEVRDAPTITVQSHGKPKSAVIQAIDDLNQRIADFDDRGGSDELRGPAGEASPRLLSHG